MTLATQPRLALPNRIQGPPGGWRYTVPETGQFFSGVTEQQLTERLAAHYKANGLEMPPNIADLIEAFICSEAAGYCVPTTLPPLPWVKVGSAAFHLVLSATRRLAGDPREQLVAPAQAAARAATCLNCPQHAPLEGCSRCNISVFQEAVRLLVGKRTTPHDEKLEVCRLCSCSLKAKVHMPLARLQSMTTPDIWEALPTACWMKTEAATTPA